MPGRLNERSVIAMIKEMQPPSPRGVLGIGDDAAFVPRAEQGWLLSQDMLVEDIHFRKRWATPEQIGAKAAEVNLSDMAAMGATARFALTSIAIAPDTPLNWIRRLYRGVQAAFSPRGVVILGGDTVASPDKLVLDVVILGTPSQTGPVLRRGARVGDRLLVSGTLGDSHAGLVLLERRHGRMTSSQSDAPLLRAHLEPKAQVELGVGVAPLVHAMTDISDGLAQELVEVIEVSGLGADIWLDSLPTSPAMRALAERLGEDAIRWAVFGGEDYQLLMAVDPSHVPHICTMSRQWGIDVTEIGVVTSKGGVRWIKNEEPVEMRGEGLAFEHFAH
ncbi:MAG: thiamine-phosphate kinase [Sulfobacillus acidophilus]|uniref:Thiamine-monophosphate kinase n=1 Tax=Sulfobacillus acidophilus TaxID=53633 RepID=A0A2T2WDX4_9FIRM|nr:MAG: thiamine-phosphate kinase [Sulfobacillus acidophilus]